MCATANYLRLCAASGLMHICFGRLRRRPSGCFSFIFAWGCVAYWRCCLSLDVFRYACGVYILAQASAPAMKGKLRATNGKQLSDLHNSC